MQKYLILFFMLVSTSVGALEMKTSPIDTIFAQGEANPYGKFFTGQTYLNMLSANDSTFNAPPLAM